MKDTIKCSQYFSQCSSGRKIAGVLRRTIIAVAHLFAFPTNTVVNMRLHKIFDEKMRKEHDDDVQLDGIELKISGGEKVAEGPPSGCVAMSGRHSPRSAEKVEGCV